MQLKKGKEPESHPALPELQGTNLSMLTFDEKMKC